MSLADLVTVRNHLQLLINNDRVLIHKNQVRIYEGIKTKLDKMFLEQVLTSYGTVPVSSGTIVAVKADSAASININDGAVIFDPNNESQQDQLALDFDKVIEPVNLDVRKNIEKNGVSKKKNSAKTEISTSDEDAKEIAKKLAVEKKKLQAKKAGGKGTSFKRNLDEVVDEE